MALFDTILGDELYKHILMGL